MRLLVIEDDKALNDIIAKRLKEEGHIIDKCFDGSSGLDYAQAMKYDCIILDIMIPKIDGISLLKTIRAQGNESKVLILTARDEVEDRVKGLDAGADDYLIKPFAFDELYARIRALVRRQGEVKDSVLILEDLIMNTNDHSVVRGEKAIVLTSKEYALLAYLLRNQGAILTRSQILDHVWNFDFDYNSNIVDVYIKYLRGKIDKGFGTKLIHTVRGFGYMMRSGDE
ncbi:response regulator transcription factor [Eubacteriaceae bacterium ES2]|nr:response regulator transcription factor [Eubacteriaceae bacterium ES2]